MTSIEALLLIAVVLIGLYSAYSAWYFERRCDELDEAFDLFMIQADTEAAMHAAVLESEPMDPVTD